MEKALPISSAGAEPFTWRDTTSRVRPALRSSRVSPTQMIGSSPALSAAPTLAAATSSVSWCMARRSEWAMMTRRAPASASISAEMSPVKAPLTSAWQSCPPISTCEPSSAWDMAASSVAGGQTATRAAAGSRSSASATAVASLKAAKRPFIFQFPAISSRVIRLMRAE